MEESEIPEFLSYYPLKQGLKLVSSPEGFSTCYIFILLSIKTRIETCNATARRAIATIFLSYYPLKQGLKLKHNPDMTREEADFYPTIH